MATSNRTFSATFNPSVRCTKNQNAFEQKRKLTMRPLGASAACSGGPASRTSSGQGEHRRNALVRWHSVGRRLPHCSHAGLCWRASGNAAHPRARQSTGNRLHTSNVRIGMMWVGRGFGGQVHARSDPCQGWRSLFEQIICPTFAGRQDD